MLKLILSAASSVALTLGLFTLISTVGIQPAHAIVAGITCASGTDQRQVENSVGGIDSSTQTFLLETACTNNDLQQIGAVNVATPVKLMILQLNSFNDGTPQFLDNFRIVYYSTVTDVSLNGAPYTSATQINVTVPTEFKVQYKYGGKTVSFTVNINPTTHTIGGFTIQDVAAPVQSVATNSAAEETQNVIAKTMLNRANHILGNQPNIMGFANGTNTSSGGPLGYLGINGNEEGMNLAFSTSRSKILARLEASHIQVSNYQADEAPNQQAQNWQGHAFAPVVGSAAISEQITDQTASNKGEEVGSTSHGQTSRTGTWDIWTEIYGSRTKAGTSDSSLWVGYLGVHTFITEHMLVGVLGQLDWADETNSTLNSNADGRGWMIGSYIAGKVPDQNVYYEARASWGRSSNKISPDGTYTDGFGTTRWLASAKISGSHVVGDVTIRPETGVSWFEETQEGYTDSIAQFIPEQTISLGEVRFGPIISRSITLADGTQVLPSIGFSGVWNFGIKENIASQGFALGNDDLRARLDGGISTVNTLGWKLALAGFYDGIGINDYDSYGGSVRLTIPLN